MHGFQSPFSATYTTISVAPCKKSADIKTQTLGMNHQRTQIEMGISTEFSKIDLTYSLW
jgi:hypothetical protein